jgi:citrate synthase
MLKGVIPTEVQVEALETYLKLTMEQVLNASTFAARVTISTESDLTSAITSSDVIDLLEEMGTQDNIRPVVEDKMKSGEQIMGFGHHLQRVSSFQNQKSDVGMK